MVNVRSVERDQLLLMPPSLSDWLPPDHLAWLIIDVVAELDLSGFYRLLRVDGRGGASYDPQVMLGVLLYAYCLGERSSRRIEQRLCDDVAFRVVAANQQSDYATVARFRPTVAWFSPQVRYPHEPAWVARHADEYPDGRAGRTTAPHKALQITGRPLD